MGDLTPDDIEKMKAAGLDKDKIDAATESVRQHSQALKDAAQSAAALNDQENDSGSIMDQLQTKLTGMLTKLEDLGNLTGADANEFSVFATAIAGAHKELTNFQSNESGRLGSFSDDMKGLIENVKN